MLARILGDRNVVLGLLLLAVAATVIATAGQYTLGTARRMGPGYFPVMLGGILALFAILIILRGLLGEHEPVEGFAISAAACVLGGALLFGLLLRHGGLIVAIVSMVVVAGLASRRLGLAPSLVLAAGLAIGSAIVFVGLLGQAIPIVGDWFRG